LIYWVILWEAKHAFATKYPEVVNKLIIAGPKFYPQHHQTILAGLNAVNFAENQVALMLKLF
jgi:hypothetical protein